MKLLQKYWETFKLFYSFIRFRVKQYYLKTGEKVVLDTTYGPITGVKRVSCFGDEFFSFEKIPFAKPPLNELRFMDPVIPDPWAEPLDCTKEPNGPVQMDLILKKLKGDEDCLYLNVFSRNLKPEKPVPVLVWIYGGGFMCGSSSKDLYSPDYFMQRNVIVVTLSYRVGPFGFLSLKDPSLKIPGNAGLKDQSLGLRWVRDNCSRFGGDPNNVTLFGESAGGASTHFHLISDHSRGLFHKAIIMSGSVLAPWATTTSYDWGYRTAKYLGYKGENEDAKVLKYLQGAKTKDIALIHDKTLNSIEREHRVIFPFSPVIEPYVTQQCMIPKDLRLMMKEAWGNNLPVLIGGTSYEGLFWYREVEDNSKIMENMENFQYLVPLELNLDVNSEKCIEFGKTLKKTYFGDEEPTKETKSILKYLDLLSYKYFWHSIYRAIKSRLRYANGPTYFYRFDFDSPTFNHARNFFCGRGIRGVSHADDLSYIFLNSFADIPNKDSMEYKTIQRFVGVITHFAETGDPSADEIKPIIWKPLDRNNEILKCVNISEEVKLIDLPENEKLKVWDSLYPKELLI